MKLDDFAGYIAGEYEVWDEGEIDPETMERPKPMFKTGEVEQTYGLRYTEFIAPLIKAAQELEA